MRPLRGLMIAALSLAILGNAAAADFHPLDRPATEARKFNILFLFADDQRADTIGALGNSVIQTPNLDRLTHAGLAFNCAYMQGGMGGDAAGGLNPDPRLSSLACHHS